MGGYSSFWDAGFVRRIEDRWMSMLTFLRMGVETDTPCNEYTRVSSSGEGAVSSVLARLDDVAESSSRGRFWLERVCSPRFRSSTILETRGWRSAQPGNAPIAGASAPATRRRRVSTIVLSSGRRPLSSCFRMSSGRSGWSESKYNVIVQPRCR
ncbi:hypothetical protein BD311DRAFT_750331, partial [Dichomitus squalens]